MLKLLSCHVLLSPGSFLKSSQKSISMVKGGRTEYAAALAWEKNKVLPNSTIHKDWIESVKDNPTIVNYKVRETITSSF